MEANGDAAALAFDRRNAQTLTHGFEDGILQKVIHGGWWSAEAVFEFLADVGLLFVGGDRGDAFVGAEAEIFAGDVIFGDANVGAEAEVVRSSGVDSSPLSLETARSSIWQ